MRKMISAVALGSILLFSANSAVASSSEKAKVAVAGEAPDGDTKPRQGDGTAVGEPKVELSLAQQVALANVERLRSAASESVVARYESASVEELNKLIQKIDSGETVSEDEKKIVELAIEIQSIGEAANLNYQTGVIDIGDNLAQFNLSDEFAFLGPDDSSTLLTEIWGNPPGTTVLGTIVPRNVSPGARAGWGVLVTYSEDGHVEDDDADDIDYDELLEQMQEGTAEANVERESAGYSPIFLTGWAEAPRYDKERRALYWAKVLSDSEQADKESDSLNYSVRLLGRKGVLELNAVSSLDQLQAIKPQVEELYKQVEFKSGSRYSDFDPDMDSMAAYGLGGLVAGKLAAKAGLFAVFLKFLLVAKKFLIIGLLGIGVFLKRMFSKKKD